MVNWEDIHKDFDDYLLQRCWEAKDFTYHETKAWVKAGLTSHDYGFASYLKQKGYTPQIVFQEKSHAQHWLDWKYPKEKRKKITYLDISQLFLQGSLKLEEFANLKKLYCSRNQLTDLDCCDCVNLEELDCDNNKLTALKLDNCLKLKNFCCFNNQLTEIKANHLTNLTTLSCSTNQLTQLNLPSPNQIHWINCGNNNLQDLSFLSALSNERQGL